MQVTTVHHKTASFNELATTVEYNQHGNRPRFQNGDRLKRQEFHRRYCHYPELKKAELIQGTVHLNDSRVSATLHGIPHAHIVSWLGYYIVYTPNVRISNNGSFLIDDDNEFQPDAVLWVEGGNAYVNDDDYLEGAPELVVEVSDSPVSVDLNEKKNIYQMHGIQEYLVLLTHRQDVRWFMLEDGIYKQIIPDNNGVLRSRIFSGLNLDSTSFWNDDTRMMLKVLQEGMKRPEHQRLVEQ
ncbi:MAG: Uma2 family endonuclease [Chloroflexota bacterium]